MWLLDHHTLVHTRRFFDFCSVDSFNAPWFLKSVKSDLHWDWSKKTITTITSNVEITWKSQAVHRAHHRWTHTHNRQSSQKYMRYESSWTFSMSCSQQKFYVVVFIAAMRYFFDKNRENQVPGTAATCWLPAIPWTICFEIEQKSGAFLVTEDSIHFPYRVSLACIYIFKYFA